MTQTSESTAAPGGAAGSGRHIYFFGEGRADGNGAMRDVLGGKGAGPRRDDQRRRAGAARLHDHHRRVPLVLRARRRAAAGIRGRSRRAALERLEQLMGKRLGDPDGSAAGVGALGRQVLDARHDGHHPQPRAQRPLGARAWRAAPATRASPGTATGASSRCSARWCMGLEKREFEQRIEALKHRRRVKTDTDLDRAAISRRWSRSSRRWCARAPAATSRRTRSSSWRWRATRCSARGTTTAPIYYRTPEPDPRRPRHRGQRAGDGVRQPGRDLGHRRGLHAQSGHRREPLLRRVPHQRAGRGRGGRRAHAAADRRAGATRCPRPTASCARSPRGSRSTTATCRTSSSRSRKARCSCCRPATASAPRRPRCAIAVDMVGEGLITREEAVLRVEPASLDQLLHPRLDPKAKLPVIAHRARRLAGRRGRPRGVRRRHRGRRAASKETVILVRKETTPDDIHGMDAAQGILTATGGMTSPRRGGRARHGQAVRLRRRRGARGRRAAHASSPTAQR